jgi:hypothetical protein
LRKFFQAPDARVAHLPVITNAAQPLRTRRQMMTRTASRLAASLTGLLLSTSAFAADFSTKRVEFLSGEDVVVGTLYVPGKAKTPSAAVLLKARRPTIATWCRPPMPRSSPRPASSR